MDRTAITVPLFVPPQMLEEDALRFDAFLKENDEKVQEAIKRAEMEAKAKQDKVLEIKRLTTAIAALRSEMNKVIADWC